MPRAKGRDNFALRRVDVDLGPIYRSDGSARFTMGLTSVLVGVQGPRPVKVSWEQYDRATVDVIVQRRAGLPASGGDSRVIADFIFQQQQAEDGQLVAFLRETMEAVILSSLHPNTCIQFIVQVLNDDGSLLAVALNGCMAALLDAGIACYTTLGSTCCCLTHDGTLLLDPDQDEEQNKAAACVCFAHDIKTKEVIATLCTGTFAEDKMFWKSEQLARKASAQVFGIMKQAYSLLKAPLS